MKGMKIGRQGSRDLVILRLDRRGLYLSIRVFGHRVWCAVGPNYYNQVGYR